MAPRSDSSAFRASRRRPFRAEALRTSPGAIRAVKRWTKKGVPPVLVRFFSAAAASVGRLRAISGTGPETVISRSPSDTVRALPVPSMEKAMSAATRGVSFS